MTIIPADTARVELTLDMTNDVREAKDLGITWDHWLTSCYPQVRDLDWTQPDIEDGVADVTFTGPFADMARLIEAVEESPMVRARLFAEIVVID